MVSRLSRFADALNPGRSLAAKLTLSIIIISLVLSLLMSVLIGKVAEQQAEQDVGALHAEYARQLADELDADLYTHQQDIKIFARLIHNTAGNESAQRLLLEQVQAAYPEYAWLGLTDTTGTIQAATHHVLEGQSAAQQSWFVAARTQPYIGDAHSAAFLTKTLPTDSSVNSPGEPPRFLDVAAPVQDAAGNAIGVLGGYLSWSWVREIQQKILTPLQLRRVIEPLIVSHEGQVLLGPADLLGHALNLTPTLTTHINTPDTTDIFNSSNASNASNASNSFTNGYQIMRWPDGHDYLVGFARGDGQADFKGLGWTILVREPTTTAFADADQLQLRLLLFGAGLGLIFAGLGAWLMRRFAQPLNQIAAAADQIQQAEFVDIPVFRGDDEVARVSRSLHSLVNTLETQVQERTREVLRLSEDNKQVAVTRERLRMARDLHDTLAHTLAGLLTEIRLLRKLAQTHPDALDLQHELALAEEAAKVGLNEARAAIIGLRNNPVREMGLEAALRQAAHRFEQHTGVATAFATQGPLPLLQDARAETLYRIAEEALHNIERHANARCVSLGLSTTQPNSALQTTLVIADDGVGFDFDIDRPIEGHYGLRGMREQAEVIDATFAVRSIIGQGTQIRVTLHSIPPNIAHGQDSHFDGR